MDTQLDKEKEFERRAISLVQGSEFSAYILADPSLEKFLFCSDVPEHGSMFAALLKARCMGFVGVITVNNGCPYTVLRTHLDPATIRVISAAYLRCIEENFTPKSDGADWLQKLWDMPDTRSNAVV